ncbi:MAG: Fic family protein [Deltaproteobacteria bacterium]|jgi:cell filamentation protein|nr:Fic family protein [Deltaproteobacteria bacterium]
MPDDFSCADPDFRYTDPATGVMRNLLNIADQALLSNVELCVSARRIEELKKNPIVIRDISSLNAVHKHLFQDIYDWAGEQRSVEISKSGSQFFPVSHFQNAQVFLNGQLSEYKSINSSDKKNVSRNFAEILDHVNYLHPFREGNGRAQREFVRLLALEKSWSLDLSRCDNADIHGKYFDGTVHGDIDCLAKLIYKILTPMKAADRPAGKIRRDRTR